MRPKVFFSLCCLAICLGSAIPALAAGPDPGKYPLRVYIFRYANQPSHSRETKHLSDMPAYVSGIGQADLFENGQPLGFQFTYSCMVEMRASAGHETFPARWKKKDRTLEILLPELKKPENLDSCELQPETTPGQVYIWKNGGVAVEPSAQLRAWMVKHQFDPESGAEDPTLKAGETETETSDPMQAPE